MTQPKASTIPDPGALGRALAENNDWRAVMIVLVVVIAMLIGFIIWREFSLIRLARSFEKSADKLAGGLDKTAEAMWAMRLSIAEQTGAQKAEKATRK